jgi:hypothetical protein
MQIPKMLIATIAVIKNIVKNHWFVKEKKSRKNAGFSISKKWVSTRLWVYRPISFENR